MSPRRPQRPPAKVFYIGFHKTGTSSIGEWLSRAGYRVGALYGANDHKFVAELAAGKFERAMRIARRFDALQDNPWPLLFPQLDQSFPGSKFILHVRDSDEWYSSVVAEFAGESTPMREFIYGDGNGDPLHRRDRYIERYEGHNRAVSEYFDRRDDLLVVDLFDDALVVEKLAGFLELAAYPNEIPKVNPRHRQPRHPRLRVASTLAGRVRRMRK